MSTICKLDPRIRERRYRRAAVVKQVEGMRHLARDFREQMMLDAMLFDLKSVIKNSWRRGTNILRSWWEPKSKEARFKAILNNSRLGSAAR